MLTLRLPGDLQRLCVCSGRGDGHQSPGAGPHEDAVPPPALQRVVRLYTLSGGSGRRAVAVEGVGSHRAQRRPVFW